MSFEIENGEFNEEPTRFRVQTRVPKEAVTDAMVMRQTRRNRLAQGDHFLVQCLDHPRETLLAEAEFVVISRTEAMTFVDVPDGDRRQEMKTTYVIERKGEWWIPASAKPEAVEKTDGKKKAA